MNYFPNCPVCGEDWTPSAVKNLDVACDCGFNIYSFCLNNLGDKVVMIIKAFKKYHIDWNLQNKRTRIQKMFPPYEVLVLDLEQEFIPFDVTEERLQTLLLFL